MISRSKSLVPINPAIVKQAAQAALAHVMATRAGLFEKEIAKRMNRRFFKAKTRETAIASMERDAEDMLTCPWKIQGWGAECSAKEYLAACELCGDGPILVSVDDARWIHSWWKKAGLL